MQTKVEICGVNTSGLPVLSAKKTDELLKKSAAGNKQARDELIRGNLRLVLSVVQRFQGRGESPVCREVEKHAKADYATNIMMEIHFKPYRLKLWKMFVL